MGVANLRSVVGDLYHGVIPLLSVCSGVEGMTSTRDSRAMVRARHSSEGRDSRLLVKAIRAPSSIMPMSSCSVGPAEDRPLVVREREEGVEGTERGRGRLMEDRFGESAPVFPLLYILSLPSLLFESLKSLSLVSACLPAYLPACLLTFDWMFRYVRFDIAAMTIYYMYII